MIQTSDVSQARPTWSVPCRDIAGRPRHLTVRSGPTVALVWPPAESASLSPGEARALAGLLDLAGRIGSGTPAGLSGGERGGRPGEGASSCAPAPAAPIHAAADVTGTLRPAASRHGGDATPLKGVPAVPQDPGGCGCDPDPVTPTGHDRGRR